MADSTTAPAPSKTDATPAPTGELRNLPDAWAQRKETPLHWLLGAYAHAKWERGVSFVTEADFDAAVQAVQDVRIDSVHNQFTPSHTPAGEK